jgi:hypothetical protein
VEDISTNSEVQLSSPRTIKQAEFNGMRLGLRFEESCTDICTPLFFHQSLIAHAAKLNGEGAGIENSAELLTEGTANHGR